jgi:hypothetical protein
MACELGMITRAMPAEIAARLPTSTEAFESRASGVRAVHRLESRPCGSRCQAQVGLCEQSPGQHGREC